MRWGADSPPSQARVKDVVKGVPRSREKADRSNASQSTKMTLESPIGKPLSSSHFIRGKLLATAAPALMQLAVIQSQSLVQLVNPRRASLTPVTTPRHSLAWTQLLAAIRLQLIHIILTNLLLPSSSSQVTALFIIVTSRIRLSILVHAKSLEMTVDLTVPQSPMTMASVTSLLLVSQS